jgi:predicted secreted Zn-dependent protease
MLREMDPNHDVFVGPVGLWMPWDPEAYKTGRVEYLEQELNQLMQEKQKNEINAKNTFDQRVKETRQNAINENIKLAEKSGNKLTQSVDENGNLIGVNNLNTQENFLTTNNEISSADIHRELFEGNTVVMNKKDTNESSNKSDAFTI